MQGSVWKMPFSHYVKIIIIKKNLNSQHDLTDAFNIKNMLSKDILDYLVYWNNT